MDIDQIWSEIASEISTTGLLVGDMKLMLSSIHSPWGDILFGLDSHQRRHLVIPMPEEPQRRQEEASRGIRIEVKPYVSELGERMYCDVSCRVEELNEMFSAVASDMIKELEGATPAASPFPLCLKVLERWRRLIERLPTRLLSRNAQAGIIAELLFLRKLAVLSPTLSIYGWAPEADGTTSYPPRSMSR